MAVFPDGTINGTVGGGDVERNVIEVALKMLKEKIPHHSETFILNQKDKKKSATRTATRTAMICGGSQTVFFELFRAPMRALFFGGGHVAQATAPLLKNLDFQIEIYDNRPDYATSDRYPEGTVIRTGDYAKMASEAEFDDATYCFVLTHGHTHDGVTVKGLLTHKTMPRYVGMIGSKIKIKETFARLAKQGVSKKRLEEVHSPIGLPIGGNTPFEIAISIVSQVQAVRYGKIIANTR